MILLGCKPKGRHVEQHDVFFGIASSLTELVPQMKNFWRDSGQLHIDAWREVNAVDGFRIEVQQKVGMENQPYEQTNKLFFINLGGYQPFKFEEQHYMLLTVKADKTLAMKDAKQTLFFKSNHFAGAASHIDDKYGIDVDDLYDIEDILPADQKDKFRISVSPLETENPDEIHLGYLKLTALK